jgi:hypothetical protein
VRHERQERRHHLVYMCDPRRRSSTAAPALSFGSPPATSSGQRVPCSPTCPAAASIAARRFPQRPSSFDKLTGVSEKQLVICLKRGPQPSINGPSEAQRTALASLGQLAGSSAPYGGAHTRRRGSRRRRRHRHPQEIRLD